MRTFKNQVRMLAGFSLVAFLANLTFGQSLPAPRLNLVMPCGGQTGGSFEMTVTGSDLDKAEGLHFSFPGAKVEVLGASAKVPPPEMAKKKGMAAPGPQLSQKFKVTLPAKVPPGIHDVRVVTKGGVSNPRAFVVGDLKEFAEQEPNDNVDKAQKIELTSSVSGVIATATDVDYYQFAGKKGQRVIVSCLSTSIDSKLPAQIQLYGASGSFLGFNRAYQNNDALLDAVLPEDSYYFVRLCSFSYTLGGQDYFYRLTVSTAPWIDAVHPAVVEPGKEVKLTVFGRNLPKGVADPASVVDGRVLEKATVTVKAPEDARAVQRLAYTGLVLPHAAALDGFEFRLSNDVGLSNPFLLTYARAPVVLDNEANDTPESAQHVPIPCEIAGRIEKKADRDFYAFTAKKGEALSIEVFGERLGAPLDLYFQIRDDKGKTLTEQDDTPDNFGPTFLTRTDDPPRYRFVAPADGTYHLLVTTREAFVQFGPRHLYTVRITRDEPDFHLIAMPLSTQTPDAVVLGQAGHQAYSLLVIRQGGFAGDIQLTAEDLPPGVTMRPQVIAGNQKQTAFVVSAAPAAPPAVGALKIVGTAVVAGKKVTREVRGATISWPVPQVNTPTITRLDRELVLAVRDKAPYSLTVDKDKFTVLQGDKLTLPIKVAAGPDFKGTVQVSALSLPTGMALAPVVLIPGKEKPVNIDSKTTVLPGNYTIVLRGQTNPPGPKPPPKPGGPPNLIQAGTPISVTIIPKQLAKLTVPNNVKVPIGKEAEFTVKVGRQFEYAGTFKVEAILPAGTKGLAINAVTLKAGEEDAKLIVRAQPDAKVGQTPTLTIRATAMFNDTTPVVHEAKLKVNITK